MNPVKHSVAFVIYNKDRSKILAVRRPENDSELPNVLGLPAGSLKDKETCKEAVLRSGREKLGIELEIVKLLNEGEIERKDYTLHMKLYEARITKGKPKVPQAVKGITHYKEWKWADPEELKESAMKGSLCSRLFLSKTNQNW